MTSVDEAASPEDGTHQSDGLESLFRRYILESWRFYSAERVLYFHQLAELEVYFHTFYSHQAISYTERMALDRSPSKVRFSASPYQNTFLKQLRSKVLHSQRVEVQYAIEEFSYYCLENIYQHAGTKGYALLNITGEDIQLVFFDKGPGIADIDNDQIPDILEAIKPKVSLINVGSRGMGLTKSIRLADDFHLYSNGYFWNKAEPAALQETEFYIRGVCIVGRISVQTAFKQPRRYMMI